MKSKEFIRQESDDRLIRQLKQLELTALGEGTALCQVCGSELREGAPVVAYAARPANEPTFELNYVTCPSDRHIPTACFTLGVRELVVRGRVGQCSDAAVQSSWPVLLAPEPLVVSPESATTAVAVPGATPSHQLPEASEARPVGGVEGAADLKQPQRLAAMECDGAGDGGDGRTTARESGPARRSDRDGIASIQPTGEGSSWAGDDGPGGDR